MTELKLENENKENTCAGLFFKCQNCYFDSKGTYCQSVKFVPMKRKSCKGCEQCNSIHENMKENKYKFKCENPVHGEEYQLKITNILSGEDDHLEDWNLEFVLVETN